MATIAYYRVSTHNQTIENQRLELSKVYNIDHEYMDEGVSGTVEAAKRDGFQAMLSFVRSGDTLLVVDLDRLGRDSIDVQTTVKSLQEKGVNVIVTRLGVDLSTDAGQLLVTILSKVAEMERRKMMERANAGRARAKAEGIHLGRKATVDPEQVMELRKTMSIAATAKALGCSPATVKRLQQAKRKAS